MAIPTVYAGTQFRSRLEARWAAFFDLLRWPWDYEPIDLEGYIPDFLIRGPQPDLTFIVEVKGCAEDVGAARDKIERSGWERAYLIVTDELHEDELYWWDSVVRVLAATEALKRPPSDEDVERLASIARTKRDLKSAWREAGNRVQWRSPRGTR